LYRRDGAERYRTMMLATDEFIRRFLLHVLAQPLVARTLVSPKAHTVVRRSLFRLSGFFTVQA
jgi:hypothetical protein